MFKRIALVLALLALPAAASAQEHQQADTPKKHEHAAAAADNHMTFPQLLISKSAELKLTEEQIARLEALSVKMAAHHKTMMGEKAGLKHEHAGAKADAAAAKHEHPSAADEAKMHEELFAIFTPEQLEKVKPMMKAHMEAMCPGGNCKLEKKVKAE